MLLLLALSAHRAGWWDVEVAYPRFVAKGAVARAANADSAKRERKAFDEFLRDAKQSMPDVKANGSAGQYELDIVPHRITDRPTVCSGYVDAYVDSAGAHPSNYYEAVNYGLVGGKVRALHLKDLFRPGVDAVGQASKGLLAVMRRDKESDQPSDVASGEWTRLSPDQAERFSFGRLGILFLFGRYDIGPGVEGSRTVLVPWSKLPGIDRKGVLKAVVGG